jgi:SagB-type dehydrogenase family enzyme
MFQFSHFRRKVIINFVNWFATFWFTSSLFLRWAIGKGNMDYQEGVMKLPPPKTEGTVSVEQAIKQRRTVRAFMAQGLDLNQLSQLLWAAYGITENSGFKRAVPSAGALYPMDVYVVVGKNSVKQIEAGVYHYEPKGHFLSLITQSDLRNVIARASLSQMWMAKAPLSLIITAEYKRVTVKYGKRGVRYAIIEAGHIGQNLFLQAEALGFKAGIVGAFHDKELIKIMNISPSHEPLLIMPIGYQA